MAPMLSEFCVCSRKRCYFADLFVRASNELGHSVYTKLGYIIYRRVLNYYSGDDDGEDAFGEPSSLPTRRECAKQCILFVISQIEMVGPHDLAAFTIPEASNPPILQHWLF